MSDARNRRVSHIEAERRRVAIDEVLLEEAIAIFELNLQE